MLTWLTPEVAANKRRGKAHAEFVEACGPTEGCRACQPGARAGTRHSAACQRRRREWKQAQRAAPRDAAAPLPAEGQAAEQPEMET
eukprot:9534649-Alexandrium_andersonii.AAC.1